MGMGGRSTGTWTLGDGFGILDGEVVDVPSLSAPGFIKAAADGKFPDISAFRWKFGLEGAHFNTRLRRVPCVVRVWCSEPRFLMCCRRFSAPQPRLLQKQVQCACWVRFRGGQAPFQPVQ